MNYSLSSVHPRIRTALHLLLTGIGIGSLAVVPASALSSTMSGTARSTTDAGTGQSARLANIIKRGDAEIERRLTSLGTLNTKISTAVKLTAADKSSLSDEVSTETNGLTSLKTKLDAETDVDSARSDAQSIINDYRVYALITPKVNYIKVADDQQVAASKLTDLAAKLQAKATTVIAQNELSDMQNKIQAAQTISSTIETTTVSLQPSDYNADHGILSGDRDKLRTAQIDLKAASTDARNIINSLKS